MLALGRALNVIINPEEFEQHIFPVYAGEDQKELFKQKVESTQHWKRAFMTLHQMLQFLKNYIFLVSLKCLRGWSLQNEALEKIFPNCILMFLL